MNVLHRSIKWVMLVAGLLTCSMFYTALVPEAALRGVMVLLFADYLLSDGVPERLK